MSTFLDEPETLELADQRAFNLAGWKKVLKDEFLRELPNRIETDEFGNTIALRLLAPEHGRAQAAVAMLLKRSMKGGRSIIACPISTSRGVKGVDVAWISEMRWKPQPHRICLTQAPEVCVEIVSPDNSRRELNLRKRLSFEAGAEEVWFRERDGRMAFFLKGAPEVAVESSTLCPEFPERVP